MSILNTTLTRRILNFSIKLHRRCVLSECEALDSIADSVLCATNRQKKVVAAEKERLEAFQLDLAEAEQEADAAWEAANSELAQYHVRQ